MTPTEVQIAQIVHSIVYNDVGDQLSMFNQTCALNSWMVTMGYKYDPDSYKYSNQCYQATYRNLKGRVIKVDYMRESDDAANVAVIRDIIAAVIDPPTQQCSEYDDPLNIRKQCINKEYIDNAVNDLAKVVTSLGRLIDWLNACGYTTQVNSENSYESIYVTIKSPHSDNNCTYKYTDLHDIFRYVIIEDHVHSVALRIAKFFADNMIDRTKANLSFDEFAAQYGWKHQFLTDDEDDKWGWVKNGVLHPLPYRSGEYMDNYKHVIHEIVGHVQCEELRLV